MRTGGASAGTGSASISRRGGVPFPSPEGPPRAEGGGGRRPPRRAALSPGRAPGGGRGDAPGAERRSRRDDRRVGRGVERAGLPLHRRPEGGDILAVREPEYASGALAPAGEGAALLRREGLCRTPARARAAEEVAG